MSFTPPCPGTYGAGPLLVAAPAVVPWRFGLLSVATIIDETDPHARNGIVYKSPACVASVQPWVDDCNSANVVVKAPTVTNENDVIRGCPFHLYAALDCKTTTLESMAAEIREAFRLDEQRGVEAEVWTTVLAQVTTTVLNASSLPADAFTLVGGVAAIESAMAACYGGQATLHGDRGLAAYAARDRQVHEVAGEKFTELGSAFAFYGGSPNTGPDGTPAPSGYAWLYGTSQLTLRRFPIEVLPEDSNQRLQYNPLTNVPYILAERTYVPSIECCAVAALVCLTC